MYIYLSFVHPFIYSIKLTLKGMSLVRVCDMVRTQPTKVISIFLDRYSSLQTLPIRTLKKF